LFQYPDNTKASYGLQTMLDIAAQPGVFAMKNGVRNMRRWDTEIPVIRSEHPDLRILTCHDEYLLHTAFDVDGILVGYGNIAPEPLIEMIKADKAKDYKKARENPRSPAAGYKGSLPPRLAHGRNRCAETWTRCSRDFGACYSAVFTASSGTWRGGRNSCGISDS
jgi:hypothetical protein